MRFKGKEKMDTLLSDRYKYDGKSEILLNQVQEYALYEVKKKEASGEYVFEEYDCDCGATSDELITIAEKDRYGLKLFTKICPRCGLLMTNPRMNQDSYNRFYDLEYRRLYSGRSVMSDAFFEKQYKRGQVIYEFVDKQYDMRLVNDVLEIGCGAGGILKYFADKGMNVKGIDLGSKYINYGINRGLDLQCGSAADLVVGGGNRKYDLIILHHVFEHFLDISSELKMIKRLLSSRGILFIAVPGIGSIPDDYRGNILQFLQNAHIRHFTLSTLKELMSWNEFELLAGNEKVVSIFRYNSAVKAEHENHYKDVLKTLKGFEKIYSERAYSREEYNGCQATIHKLNTIIELQRQWFKANRQGKSICPWLRTHGIKRVAIYGLGILGNQLYSELENTEIEIPYIIDSRDLHLENIKQYFPNDRFPEVDAVIVTPVSQYMEIEEIIKKGNDDLSVLRLVDIISEL